jgi:23S rRNA pseudouridine1911/1915/1917 synthase
MNSSPLSFVISSEQEGMRLDRVLVQQLPELSRTRIQELIRDDAVSVEGEPATRMSQSMEPGWRIEVVMKASTRIRSGGPEDTPLKLIFEDEHLAVIDKEAGCVAHPSTVIHGGTVSERAVQMFGELPSAQGTDRPGIVHRLDADTTGVMVVVKSAAAAAELVRMFRDHEVKKSYQALIFGTPRFDTDWIEVPIGRQKGRPDRMSVVEDGMGRSARTYYETLERFPGFGHLNCQPETGRTHQIRVHLGSIDHPLVGDRVYRGRRGLNRTMPKGAPKMERHALHASKLAFKHPVTGEALSFSSPLPEDMQELLHWLRLREASAPT